MLPKLLLAALALAPTLASAAIFPAGSKVRQVDAKGFRQAMKSDRAAVVAFVAPWCGHCQRMAPEYAKAASALDPLIPLYAVDCDAAPNKALCAEQQVKGFPTVKLFKRGAKLPAVDFDSGERTAKGFYYWATRGVPDVSAALKKVEDVEGWVRKKADKPHALLLHKDKKLPLLWTVLSNTFRAVDFASLPDTKGTAAAALSFPSPSPQSTLLVYAAGATRPVRYEGAMKWEALSKFLKSVVEGTADISAPEASPEATPEVPREGAEQVVFEAGAQEPVPGQAPKDEL